MLFRQSRHLMCAQRNRENQWQRLQRQVRLWSVITLVGVTFVSMGCSEYSAAKHRVDANVAYDTLEKVLSQWQQGGSPEDCRAMTPPVVVQDMEWTSGVKLHAFEIVGPGEARDANYYCEVTLSFKSADRAQRAKTVVYLVGTSPVLTVFRSPAP